MRRLEMSVERRVEWREAADPAVEGPGEAIVRPLAVALCDLDQPMLRGETPIPGPIALGHECVAEVVETGEEVETVAPGDRVVVPFQISCGTCARCRRGLTGSCETVPFMSMYGFGAFGRDWGGVLADLVRVPFADAMLVAVPAGVDSAAVASASDNVPDGWRAVAAPLAERPGADVLVLGGGAPSIGLYAAGAARALGAGEVHYVDTDPERLRVAEALGAAAVEGPPVVRRGRYPITVDASLDADALATALRSTEPGGTCTSVSIFFAPSTPMPLLEMYTTGLTFRTGRVMARPAIPEILEHVAAGRLRPDLVTSRVAAWEDAPDAVLEPETKLVIARD